MVACRVQAIICLAKTKVKDKVERLLELNRGRFTSQVHLLLAVQLGQIMETFQIRVFCLMNVYTHIYIYKYLTRLLRVVNKV